MGGKLMSTEELAQILHEADVRIFDCTTLSITNHLEVISLTSPYPGWTRSWPRIFPMRTFWTSKENSLINTPSWAS